MARPWWAFGEEEEGLAGATNQSRGAASSASRFFARSGSSPGPAAAAGSARCFRRFGAAAAAAGAAPALVGTHGVLGFVGAARLLLLL